MFPQSSLLNFFRGRIQWRIFYNNCIHMCLDWHLSCHHGFFLWKWLQWWLLNHCQTSRNYCFLMLKHCWWTGSHLRIGFCLQHSIGKANNLRLVWMRTISDRNNSYSGGSSDSDRSDHIFGEETHDEEEGSNRRRPGIRSNVKLSDVCLIMINNDLITKRDKSIYYKVVKVK